MITEQTVRAEMNAFGNLSTKLHLAHDDTLNYLWWDQLQSAALSPDGAEGKEFLVGLEPAAYISASKN